jgi:chloramphenicol 3-O-phosphotransferase
VTGVSAAGKSSVAAELATRFARSAHVRGDVFRKMIVAGRDPISAELGEEALRQLELRRRLSVHVADEYWRNGFTVVLQDIFGGSHLSGVLDSLSARPLHAVVLVPSLEAVVDREAARNKTGYRGWDVAEMYEGFMADTPRVGLWLDTTEMTITESVDEILRRRAECVIAAAPRPGPPGSTR